MSGTRRLGVTGSLIALVAVGSVSVRAGESSPEEVLKNYELTRSGKYFVLEDDSIIRRKLEEIHPLRSDGCQFPSARGDLHA